MLVTRDDLSALVRQEISRLTTPTASTASNAEVVDPPVPPVRPKEKPGPDEGFTTIQRRKHRRKDQTADSKAASREGLGAEVESSQGETAGVDTEWKRGNNNPEPREVVRAKKVLQAPQLNSESADQASAAVPAAHTKPSTKAEKTVSLKPAAASTAVDLKPPAAAAASVTACVHRPAKKKQQAKRATKSPKLPPKPSPKPSPKLSAKLPPKETESVKLAEGWHQLAGYLCCFWRSAAPAKKPRRSRSTEALDKAIEIAAAERMEQRLKQRFEWLENQTTGTQLVGVALIFLICYQLSRAVWANMYNETNLYSPATAPLTHDFSVDPSGPAAAVNTMSTGSASDNSAVNQAGQ